MGPSQFSLRGMFVFVTLIACLSWVAAQSQLGLVIVACLVWTIGLFVGSVLIIGALLNRP